MGGLSHPHKAVAKDLGISTDDEVLEQQGTALKTTATTKPHHAVKTSRMLKDIAPSLADPPSTRPASANNVLGLIHDDAMFMTRSSTRGLTNLAKGKPLSPTKNYNLKDLVKKQEMQEAQPVIEKEVNDRKSTRGDGRELRMPQKVSERTAENKKRKNMAGGRMSREQEQSGRMSLLEGTSDHDDDQSTQPLMRYQARKDEILKRLLTPHYTLSSRKAPLHPDVPEGFNMHMEKSVFVFKPEPQVFGDFVHFLDVVEDIAGRTQGVVKVILPTSTDTTTWGSPSPSRGTTAEDNRTTCAANGSPINRSHPVTMQTHRTLLVAHKFPRTDITFAYGIETRNDRNVLASAWRDRIEVHRKETAASWSIDIDQEGGTWKEAVYENTYGEEHMINALAKHVVHALDAEAKHEVRAALRCKDIGLENFAGNSLFKSQSRIPAIHSPKFQVAKTSGAVFGLRMEEYAAYLLSVLHVGPPRRWVVVKPTHHARLEEILFDILRGAGRSARLGGNQVSDVPQCNQFIKHEALYLPKEFLDTHEIEYTLVVQHQSEMIITFPFAYHQEFDTGPNINESMLYASKHWESFTTQELHVPCSDVCPGSPVNVEFKLGRVSRKAPSKRLHRKPQAPARSRAKKAATGENTPKRRRIETHTAARDWEDDEDGGGELGGTDIEHAKSEGAGNVRKKRKLVRGNQV